MRSLLPLLRGRHARGVERARKARQRAAARAVVARACNLESLEGRVLLSTATIGVNATQNVHAISPLIYGTNTATTATIQDLGLTGARDGGNASDTYWQLNATNHGSDWYYESIGNGGTNGSDMDTYINNAKAGGATPQMTVDIMGYAAKTGSGGALLGSYPTAVYGAQQQTDPYHSEFGNG